MKSAYLAGVVVIVVLAAALGYWGLSSSPSTPAGDSNCTYSQMNYYFRQSCHLCQQVASDGSLEKLGELGVKVDKFEVVDWGMYGIYSTPTFEFSGQRVSGYKSFQELKQLLGCKI